MGPEEVVIIPYCDGPYLVRGPVVLRDQDGGEIDAGRRTIALCRCGKSRLRPFCDGTHHLVRFRAPSAAEARGSAAAPDDGQHPADDGRLAAARSEPSPPTPLPAQATPDPELAEIERDLARLRRRLVRLSAARGAPEARPPEGEAARLLRTARLLGTASAVLQAGQAGAAPITAPGPGAQATTTAAPRGRP